MLAAPPTTSESIRASRVPASISRSGKMGEIFPLKMIPVLAGACGLAYIFYDLTTNRKVFGGSTPRTMDPAWWAETSRKFDEGWPREASENPVVMNPISRQNYRKVQ